MPNSVVWFLLGTILSLSEKIDKKRSLSTSDAVFTLKEAIEYTLITNCSLLQTGYTLLNQQIALNSARSDFDFKVRLSASIGTGDGRETFDR